MFTSTAPFARPLIVLCTTVAPAYAAIFPDNLLGLDETTITNTLEARGYDVRTEVKDFNYKATYKDPLKEYLNGSFSLCKGKTISVVVGIDSNTDYEDQLKLLLKEYGQPAVAVQIASLRDGDTSYVDLEWESKGQRVNLESYPPSKLWKTATTTRTALLTFLDLTQKCYFIPAREKSSE